MSIGVGPMPNGSRHKGRALGSTSALVAGASIDEVVAHGNWASRNTFETFIHRTS
jgi:hypothetical protein